MPAPSPLSLDRIVSLQKSDRMPVIFLGHGSPMNALPGNEYFNSWQALGAEFGSKMARPELILCISAHWLTEGWQLTAMARPKTIHDFGGFPQSCLTSNTPHRATWQQHKPSASWSASAGRCHWGWTRKTGAWTTAPGAF